jgi:hypothetical protein
MALTADNGYGEAFDTKHFISTATKLPEMATASADSRVLVLNAKL